MYMCASYSKVQPSAFPSTGSAGWTHIKCSRSIQHWQETASLPSHQNSRMQSPLHSLSSNLEAQIPNRHIASRCKETDISFLLLSLERLLKCRLRSAVPQWASISYVEHQFALHQIWNVSHTSLNADGQHTSC